ncbi:inhibitor of nuclear factor kappa-B kinase subunit beta [Calliphora vicina]|uniref:inhibitor of nuclear factor kappa-B kinase subunit beta n=1 Tax=Calliphora vicina TaxID=7373 RepID=UPI00325AFD42
MNKLPLRSSAEWQLVKPLGEGAFGEVHHWKHHRTGQEIATKRLKDNPKLKPDEISILLKRWLEEYKWMQDLEIPYIVRGVPVDREFLQHLVGTNQVEHSLPVIVMEYCNGGDLRSHLNQIRNVNGLTEYEVRNILYALLCAIQYLHETVKIEHRDIKPENIVSHVEGNKKIYKLTDFGYAREIPESTVAQSVVGTRNYVAPEVIDPGTYTKTVDYWSIGIVAYEIVCGTQPFIPHQTFVNRMRSIQNKTKKCIAIVQNVEDPANEDFQFINHLPKLNQSSIIFNKYMEDWLRLALDKHYKTRGCNNNNELKFFTDFNVIFEKKIVSVFSIKTYKKYYYDIEEYSSVHEFFQKISYDNGIDINNIFVIYPPLHPHKNSQNPVDYFVSDWYDTTNADNPPVMLFVGEFLIQSQCNIAEEKHFNLTDTIRACMCMNPHDDNIPLWLLQQFEKDIHFILTNEQHHLECYLMGLHNYIIEIEYQMFLFKDSIDRLNKKSSELIGSVKHANVVLNVIFNIQNGQIANPAKEKANFFAIKCQEFEEHILPMFNNIYSTTLQNVRGLASSQMYKEQKEKDIFQLLKYRKGLSRDYNPDERLQNAQCAFETCMQAFKGFIKSTAWNTVRENINVQLQEFNKLRQNVQHVLNEIERLENELYVYTGSLIRQLKDDTILPMTMNSLHIDGVRYPHTSAVFDNETPQLLNDFQSLIKDMETMNVEEYELP